MNWDAIGAVGEILGALAVFASLVYLALQIRNQNAEARMASAHNVVTSFREAIAALQGPETAALIAKAGDDLDLLDEAEYLRMIAFAQSYLRVWEEAHYYYAEGRLDPSMWQAICRQFGSLMDYDWLSSTWETRKPAFREEFQQFMDHERDRSIGRALFR